MKHYRDMLAVLFKYAVQWGWTGSSPLEGVNRITKIRNERMRYLSDDERKRLLDACKASDNEHLYPVVVFALSTGARKSEILGLTLADLDLDRDTACPPGYEERRHARRAGRPSPALGPARRADRKVNAFYDGPGGFATNRAGCFRAGTGLSPSTSARPGRTPATRPSWTTSASMTCATRRRATWP
jgi:integrase